MTPVLQVLVTAAAAALGAVLHSRLSRRWPTGGWPLVGIVCVVAFLLGAAYATIDISDVFGRLPLLIGTGFLAACAPLTTLLRGGPPPGGALGFGRMVVGYLTCVTAFLIVGAAVMYAGAKVFFP